MADIPGLKTLEGQLELLPRELEQYRAEVAGGPSRPGHIAKIEACEDRIAELTQRISMLKRRADET